MRPLEWQANRTEVLPACNSIEEAEALALVKYPAYTKKNPNPETGKPDCPIEKRFKDGAREAYKKKLINAISTEKRVPESEGKA